MKDELRIEFENVNGRFETYISRKQYNLILKIGDKNNDKALKKLNKIINKNVLKNKYKKIN